MAESTLHVVLSNLAVRVATQCKTILTLVNGNAADLSALTTTAKGNLVAAINEINAELEALAEAGAASINDNSGASTTQTYSIDKIKREIADAKSAVQAAILNGAGAAYDTLAELQALLQNSDSAIGGITTALAVRLRFDLPQALTAAEKAQGNANLGSASLADTGPLDTNYVQIFEAGLV